MNTTIDDKAKELVGKFKDYAHGGVNEDVIKAYNEMHGEGERRFSELYKFSKIYYAKQCALVCIEEILEAIQRCGVVAGYPLYEYQKLKEKIQSL
jgi:hypothetical protein